MSNNLPSVYLARHGPKIPGLDILYVKSLAARFRVNTVPEATLKALAIHTDLGGLSPTDGGSGEEDWDNSPTPLSILMPWLCSFKQRGAWQDSSTNNSIRRYRKNKEQK